jgi:hypothetical protein
MHTHVITRVHVLETQMQGANARIVVVGGGGGGGGGSEAPSRAGVRLSGSEQRFGASTGMSTSSGRVSVAGWGPRTRVTHENTPFVVDSETVSALHRYSHSHNDCASNPVYLIRPWYLMLRKYTSGRTIIMRMGVVSGLSSLGYGSEHVHEFKI